MRPLGRRNYEFKSHWPKGKNDMKYYIKKVNEKVEVVDENGEILNDFISKESFENSTGKLWGVINEKYQNIVNKKIIDMVFFEIAKDSPVEIKSRMTVPKEYRTETSIISRSKKSSLDDIDTSLLDDDEIALLNKLKNKLSNAEKIEKINKQIEKVKAQLIDLQNQLAELEAQND